jgi:hypothetical protein
VCQSSTAVLLGSTSPGQVLLSSTHLEGCRGCHHLCQLAAAALACCVILATAAAVCACNVQQRCRTVQLQLLTRVLQAGKTASKHTSMQVTRLMSRLMSTTSSQVPAGCCAAQQVGAVVTTRWWATTTSRRISHTVWQALCCIYLKRAHAVRVAVASLDVQHAAPDAAPLACLSVQLVTSLKAYLCL